MADYDNTDKGAAFKPFDKQRLILQGKVNDGGREKKVVLIKDETKSGKQIIEILGQRRAVANVDQCFRSALHKDLHRR